MKYIRTKDVGEGKIDLTDLMIIEEIRPTELIHKSNGAKPTKTNPNDSPSFALLLTGSVGIFVAQFSLNTIVDAFNELGYTLKKK